MNTEELEEKAEQREPRSATEAVPGNPEAAAPSRSLSPRSRIMLLGFTAAAILAVTMWYFHAQTYESTDDAQVDGHINAVSSRITGSIAKVYVDDNQTVVAGQPLIDLDPRELTIAEEQSAAQYAQASARMNSEMPNLAITQNTNQAEIEQAQSKVADARAALDAAQHDRQSAASRLVEAKATSDRDQLQADRYRQLYQKEEASQQEFENYQATAQASAARLAAAQAELASADEGVEQRQAQLNEQIANSAEVKNNAPDELALRRSDAESQRADVQLTRAALDKASLDLSFAHILAPISGVVTQRSAEPGNHISPGEQLLMIVDTSHLWITADFKETQLGLMRPGCRAIVKVDALGRSFQGTVESMPAITGARASVLPPENATGNFVKVVQRLPVRIVLDSGQPEIRDLRPGMSVEAKVYVK